MSKPHDYCANTFSPENCEWVRHHADVVVLVAFLLALVWAAAEVVLRLQRRRDSKKEDRA